MSYKLYGAALSPFVRKTRAFMREKGLEYQSIYINPFDLPDDYVKINPLKRIPALADGDKTLADSAVICAYIEQKHSDTALYPSSAYEYARCLWFEKYADYEIATQTTFWVFRQRLMMPLIGKTCQEDKVQKALTQGLPPLLDYLEGELAGHEFLVGDQLTVADIALASQFVNLEHGGEASLLDGWPQLKAHRDRVLARESFQGLLPKERQFVAQMRGAGK